jgi:flavin-dependent dehydrogenase
MDHFEVIIVGGGPAGSSVANRLALNDHAERTLLFEGLEGKCFSRYHRMCAEGISSKGLMETGLEFSGIVKNRVSQAIEHWPGEVTLRSAIDGLIIDRNELIARLREPFMARGGNVELSRVTGVVRRGDKYILKHAETECSCDFLVGADGANSVIRRSLFGLEPPNSMRVVQYLVDKPAEDCLRFEFDERYHGKYRWEFPSGHLTKMGFPLGADEKPANVLEVQSRIIPIGPLDRFVEGRACLVGDAASQANPVTFSGIRAGMTAGRMAADAIVEEDLQSYQSGWDACALADRAFYDSYLRVRSMPNNELARLLEPMRHGPSFNGIMRELMTSDDFRSFYRGYVRKLECGW